MITIQTLSVFLNHYFDADRFMHEQPGIMRASPRSVHRLGLALDPWPGLAEWVQMEHLDALLLHRPFKLETNTLPDELGLLGYHLPLEEKLALGYNTRLADALGMTKISVLGRRAGRPLGMMGNVPPQTVAEFYKSVTDVFGGREDARTCERNEVCQVAVVGAMTQSLMQQAAMRGADVYITGQFRQPARQTVLETGLGVVVVGHRRSEEWALRTLAHVIQERFSGLTVMLPPRRPGEK